MHDGMQYDPIQGQGQGHEPFNVGKLSTPPFTMGAGTDHWFLYHGTISKFCQAGFLIFVLVFVSRDFELDRNVSCEESTVSPVRG